MGVLLCRRGKFTHCCRDVDRALWAFNDWFRSDADSGGGGTWDRTLSLNLVPQTAKIITNLKTFKWFRCLNYYNRLRMHHLKTIFYSNLKKITVILISLNLPWSANRAFLPLMYTLWSVLSSTGVRDWYRKWHRVAQNRESPGSSFKFVIKRRFELSRNNARNV